MHNVYIYGDLLYRIRALPNVTVGALPTVWGLPATLPGWRRQTTLPGGGGFEPRDPVDHRDALLPFDDFVIDVLGIFPSFGIFIDSFFPRWRAR